MSKIPINQFEKAKVFIKAKARELEKALFTYEFENGDKEDVIKQLKAYQNEDGGFGHGIEPDFWLPDSSPMATWTAGQILMEIGADKNEPMIKAMIAYLVSTVNQETGRWDSVLPEVNHYPHAPWWTWHEGVQENWTFNPSAELAAFLVHWSEEGSDAEEIGWSVLKKAVNHLVKQDEMDRHELNNYQQLVEIMKPYESVFDANLPFTLKSVSEQVLMLAEKCVDRDVSNWSVGYKPLPLDFINSPDHPLCERFGLLVEENLKFYAETLTDEGVWDISWNWESYPEQFETARTQWKGILAVNRYKQLKAFGYLQ